MSTSVKYAKWAEWAVVPVGLIISAALVWQASYAAFSATTVNPTSAWATGTVVLSDDDSGTAMFNAANLKPGQSATKCIEVTYSGNLAAVVRAYGTGKTATNGLDSYLDLVVEQGGGGTFGGGCAGFTANAGIVYSGTLAAFAAVHTDFGSGFGSWLTPNYYNTRTFKITYTLNAAAPNSTQGATAAMGLTWEAQDGPAGPNHLDSTTAGFEGGGLGQWGNWYNTNLAASSEQANSGSGSMRVDVTAPFWGVEVKNSPGFAADPGTKTIRFWGRLGSGAGLTAKLEIDWVDSAGAVLQSDSVTTPTLTATWQQATGSVVAPAGTATAFLKIRGPGSAGDYLYIDDVYVG